MLYKNIVLVPCGHSGSHPCANLLISHVVASSNSLLSLPFGRTLCSRVVRWIGQVVGSHRLGLIGNSGCGDRTRGGGNLGSGWGGAFMRGRVMADYYTLGGISVVIYG